VGEITMINFSKNTVFFNESVTLSTGTAYGWQKKVVKAGNYFYCTYSVNTSEDDPYEIRVSKSIDGLNWEDTGFPTTLIVGNSNLGASITVDSTNKIHLCFNKDGFNNSGDGTAKIVYSTYAEGIGWSALEELTAVGYSFGYPVITLDLNDKPHISYGSYGGGNYEVYYTNKVSGSWLIWEQANNVDIRIQEYKTSIFIDSNNEVNIFFIGSDTTSPDYGIYRSYGSSGSWNTELILETSDIAFFDICIDNSDNFHIVGHNFSSGKLEYYKKSGVSYALISSSVDTWGLPWSIQVVFANNVIHIVYDDSKQINSIWNYRCYYTSIINDSFSDLTNIDDNALRADNPSIFVNSKNIMIITSDFTNDYIYSYLYEFPMPKGKILILEYTETKTAETDTTTTNIKITNHGLITGDFIVNETRRATTQRGAERGSRKITYVDDDNIAIDTAMAGQTTGDSIRLYKWIDRTEYVKLPSISFNKQAQSEGNAGFTMLVNYE
jgi:hypothetical protein